MNAKDDIRKFERRWFELNTPLAAGLLPDDVIGLNDDEEETNLNEEVICETRMPRGVLQHKIRIRKMSDDEKKKYFAGKSVEWLKSMAWRHGYGKDSMEYAKHHVARAIGFITSECPFSFLPLFHRTNGLTTTGNRQPH
jgi:hypothetical protein